MVLILLILYLVNKLSKDCCIFKGLCLFMVGNGCRIKVTKFLVANAEEACAITYIGANDLTPSLHICNTETISVIQLDISMGLLTCNPHGLFSQFIFYAVRQIQHIGS